MRDTNNIKSWVSFKQNKTINESISCYLITKMRKPTNAQNQKYNWGSKQKKKKMKIIITDTYILVYV